MGIEGNVVILQAAVLSIGSHMVGFHLCHTRVGFPVNSQHWEIFQAVLRKTLPAWEDGDNISVACGSC